jgi:hypothetical protein
MAEIGDHVGGVADGAVRNRGIGEMVGQPGSV